MSGSNLPVWGCKQTVNQNTSNSFHISKHFQIKHQRQQQSLCYQTSRSTGKQNGKNPKMITWWSLMAVLRFWTFAMCWTHTQSTSTEPQWELNNRSLQSTWNLIYRDAQQCLTLTKATPSACFVTKHSNVRGTRQHCPELSPWPRTVHTGRWAVDHTV